MRKTNKTKIQQREILVALDTQDIGGRQTKQEYNKKRYWQHQTHKIQEEDKQNKNITKRDTGNTRHTRYRRKTNKTKIQQKQILATLDTQDIGGRQTKQK